MQREELCRREHDIEAGITGHLRQQVLRGSRIQADIRSNRAIDISGKQPQYIRRRMAVRSDSSANLDVVQPAETPEPVYRRVGIASINPSSNFAQLDTQMFHVIYLSSRDLDYTLRLHVFAIAQANKGEMPGDRYVCPITEPAAKRDGGAAKISAPWKRSRTSLESKTQSRDASRSERANFTDFTDSGLSHSPSIRPSNV